MVTHTKFTKVPILTPPLLCCDVNADKVHLPGRQLMATHFTSSTYSLGSQVKFSTAKKIHPETGGWFLEAHSVMTNFRAKVTNSIAKWTNSIAKMTNSFANGTNSIAKATNSIAKTCNHIHLLEFKEFH